MVDDETASGLHKTKGPIKLLGWCACFLLDLHGGSMSVKSCLQVSGSGVIGDGPVLNINVCFDCKGDIMPIWNAGTCFTRRK